MAELRNWRGPEAVKAIRGRLRNNANGAMLLGVNAIKRKLTSQGGSRTGVHYPTLANRSAAPGQPPQTQTGTLLRGVTGRVEDDGNTIVILVGVSGVEYAPYQEFGTSRMPAHPFVRPAVQENKRDIFKALGGR